MKHPAGPRAARGISDEARRQKQQRRRARFKAYTNALKEAPCADCGNNYPPVCMDFDHLPGTDKKFDISAVSKINGWKALKDEVTKCEIVCANCHRLRTRDRS